MQTTRSRSGPELTGVRCPERVAGHNVGDSKEGAVSVLMTMRARGDTAKFREFVTQNPDLLRTISEDARSKGCLAHRFGVGDGFVMVWDEWESPEAFDRFFVGNEQVGRVMEASGAHGEPEIVFSEAIATADQF
jgi:hypothetical protein